MEESVRKETQRASALVAPDLHAVLLLVPVNQFTEVGPCPICSCLLHTFEVQLASLPLMHLW